MVVNCAGQAKPLGTKATVLEIDGEDRIYTLAVWSGGEEFSVHEDCLKAPENLEGE